LVELFKSSKGYNFPDYGIPEAKALFEAIRAAHESEKDS